MEHNLNTQINQKNFPEVICFGEALLDRLGPLGGDPECDSPVEDCLGGAPANVACALARLGTQAAFIGCLGTDEIGSKFKHLMVSRDVDIQGLQVIGSIPTRIVLVRRDSMGERSFQGFSYEKGNIFADQLLNINDLKESWGLIASKASWLLIGTIPMASTVSAEALLWSVEKAYQSGIKIAIDINWRPTFWDPNSSPDRAPSKSELLIIRPILEKASLIKLAKEEAIWFFATYDPKQISDLLPQKPDIVVTDGAETLRWYVSGFFGEMQPIAPPEIIDTTGAGDAFTAGFLNQLLACPKDSLTLKSINDSVIFAAGCGALVCTGAGAINPQPTKDQVNAFLSELEG